MTLSHCYFSVNSSQSEIDQFSDDESNCAPPLQKKCSRNAVNIDICRASKDVFDMEINFLVPDVEKQDQSRKELSRLCQGCHGHYIVTSSDGRMGTLGGGSFMLEFGWGDRGWVSRFFCFLFCFCAVVNCSFLAGTLQFVESFSLFLFCFLCLWSL